MPLAEARALITSDGGTLTCRATPNRRMRECTGSLGSHTLATAIRVLLSAIDDSAAVIVLSGSPGESASLRWVDSLAAAFGPPNRERQPGGGGSWQWIRRSQMLRVVLRGTGRRAETAITFTDGPLLDSLSGVAPMKKPDGGIRPASR